MTQPTAYGPTAVFVSFAPSGFPNLGTNLDTEFGNIKLTTDQIRTNLAIIQRDDTNLANGVVTPDSLSTLTKQLLGTTGWTPKGAWLTGTSYALKDVVSQAGIGYVCLVAHTSGVFATDLAAVKWLAFTNAMTTSAFGLSMLAAADATASLTLLGLTISAFMKTVLDDADASTARTTLGVQGKQTLSLPAGAWTPRVSLGPGSTITQSTTNNVLVKSLDFDTSTQEFAACAIGMPESWNEGTVTFRARWTAESGSGGVAWQLRAVAASDGDAIDTAYGAAVIVTDTLILAKSMHITSESAAITIAATPAARDTVIFEIARVPADAGDTLGVDARLIGVDIYITYSACVDA
jgi:hypothetical protein